MKEYFVGFDAGSTYIKAALIKNDEIISTRVFPTGIDNQKLLRNYLNY